jgi:hypothetical protein
VDQEMKGKMRVLLIATGTKEHKTTEMPAEKKIEAIKKTEPEVTEKFDPNPFFDIKETETFSPVIAPKEDDEKEESVPPARSQKIFHQNCDEEIKGDLDILKE